MSDFIGYLLERVAEGIAEGARQRAQSAQQQQQSAPGSAPSADPRVPRQMARGARAAERAAKQAARGALFGPPPAPVPSGVTVQALGRRVDAVPAATTPSVNAVLLPAAEQSVLLPPDDLLPVASLVRTPRGLREAVVAAEILAPPLALRQGEPSRGY